MEELFKPYDLTSAEPLEVAKAIVRVLDERKASNVKLLRVSDETSLTDYFVICTGHSNTQIKGLADEVDFKMGLCGLEPKHIEGDKTSKWILLDYYSVIVHVFTRDARDFYKLEKLWENAEEVNIDDVVTD